jgi:hypothetical protein
MNSASNPFIRILAIVVLLSGCASVPQHLTEENKSGIRTIAIVSLVPENVHFDKIGIFSTSNVYTAFDMGSRVNDSILYVSKGRVAKSYPGWTVKSIDYDRAALLEKTGSTIGYNATGAKEAFAELARNNDLDALLVIRAAADKVDPAQQGPREKFLGEGLNVLLKNNSINGDMRLEIRSNLSVAVIGKQGEVLAMGTVPAKLNKADALEPDDYDVSVDMKHNHRTTVLAKLGVPVIADLSNRLNLCFDTLGFVDGSDPETQHVNVVVQPPAVTGADEKSSGQATPAADLFEQCFSRCRQYTDRSKEQCFDACNK